MSDPCAQALSLARTLELPGPALEPLTRAAEGLDWGALDGILDALRDAPRAEAAQKALQDRLGPGGGDGMAELAVQLAAACRTRERYRAAGLDDGVFLDTMGCFSRFLGETRANTGRWAFDRGFWTWRQLSCVLVRLGALEYEYRAAAGVLPEGLREGDRVLHVHIPSGTRLTRETLDGSYARLRAFFKDGGAALCTAGAPRAVLCGTWLLSPALEALLPEGSGIRCFAGDYARYWSDGDNDEFYGWLFGKKAPPEELPQETRLQRAVRAHLACGGKIGAARGVLRADQAGSFGLSQ